MSIDRSLATSGKMRRHRSVLTRSERLVALEGDERWQEGDSIYGLPKVKTVRAIKRHKVKKEEEADAAAPEGQTEAAAGTEQKEAEA